MVEIGERSPVGIDEIVLRRIPNIKDFIDIELAQPIARVAVGPNRNDIDGLSVFRANFVTPKQLADAGSNRNGYYIASIKVEELNMIGLTVIPDAKDDQLPGHALIPELKYSKRRSDKNNMKPLLLKLACLASQNIVFQPV